MVKVIGTQLSMLARHGKFLQHLLCTQSPTSIYQFVCNYFGFPSRYFFSNILQGQSAKDLVSPECPAGHPSCGEGQFACKAYCKGACATGSLKSDFHLKYVKNIVFFSFVCFSLCHNLCAGYQCRQTCFCAKTDEALKYYYPLSGIKIKTYSILGIESINRLVGL